VLFGSQSGDKPQASLLVGEDTYNPGPAPNLLMQALQAICGSDSSPVFLGEIETGKNLISRFLQELSHPWQFFGME